MSYVFPFRPESDASARFLTCSRDLHMDPAAPGSSARRGRVSSIMDGHQAHGEVCSLLGSFSRRSTRFSGGCPWLDECLVRRISTIGSTREMMAEARGIHVVVHDDGGWTPRR